MAALPHRIAPLSQFAQQPIRAGQANAPGHPTKLALLDKVSRAKSRGIPSVRHNQCLNNQQRFMVDSFFHLKSLTLHEHFLKTHRNVGRNTEVDNRGRIPT